MKVKSLVLIAVVVVFVGFVSSCEKNDTAETEEIYGRDRSNQRPGTQDGNS